MSKILAHEAQEVCGRGVIALPVHMGKPSGRVENVSKRPGVHDGQLRLSSGRKMPWTPAANIGW